MSNETEDLSGYEHTCAPVCFGKHHCEDCMDTGVVYVVKLRGPVVPRRCHRGCPLTRNPGEPERKKRADELTADDLRRDNADLRTRLSAAERRAQEVERERDELRKGYLDVADAVAKESDGPRDLAQKAKAMRRERDEARARLEAAERVVLELTSAADMLDAIARIRGLAQGGEQYPNVECVVDRVRAIRRAIATYDRAISATPKERGGGEATHHWVALPSRRQGSLRHAVPGADAHEAWASRPATTVCGAAGTWVSAGGSERACPRCVARMVPVAPTTREPDGGAAGGGE